MNQAKTLSLTVLAMIVIIAFISGCAKTPKPLPVPHTSFVAVFRSSANGSQDTIESDGMGHIGCSQRIVFNNLALATVKPNNVSVQWQFRDYPHQSSYSVIDVRKIFYKEPAFGGIFLVDEPPDVVAAAPSLRGNARLVGVETVDGYTCEHYTGSFQHPLEDSPTDFDVWYSRSLHCAVKTSGLASGEQRLVSYKARQNSEIAIPKTYRAVDVYAFVKALDELKNSPPGQ